MTTKENFESAEERISLSFMLALCLCAFLYLIPSMSLADDEVGLSGLVNIDCDAEDKRAPIVLIHGTFANAKRAFSSLAPVLKDSGHCLYAINYGRRGIFSFNGTMDINESVKEVSRFVESVLIRMNA